MPVLMEPGLMSVAKDDALELLQIATMVMMAPSSKTSQQAVSNKSQIYY